MALSWGLIVVDGVDPQLLMEAESPAFPIGSTTRSILFTPKLQITSRIRYSQLKIVSISLHGLRITITARQNPPLAVDSRLLLSYNHLLLIPVLVRLFAGVGDGVAGPILDSRNVSRRGELRPSGDDPKLCLRPVSLLPFDTALYSNGLFDGEKEAPPEAR